MMEIESMNCFFCVLKHIAGALSYAKEILNGHGIEKALDHRIDFLGELVNLQHHLELYNGDYAEKVRLYREDVQFRSLRLKEADLAFLRGLFKEVQLDNQDKREIPEEQPQKLSSNPVILFLEIKDQAFFELCYTVIKRNLSNYTNIYCLNVDFDLASFPSVIKTDFEAIKEENIIVFPDEKSILLRKWDSMQKFSVSSEGTFPFQGQKNSLKSYIETRDYRQYIRECGIKTENEREIGFRLNKKLCCSNRYYAQTRLFCYVENQEALQSMKEYLKVD